MLLWSIARASALVAFAAYTGVVIWGMLVAGRAFRPAAPAVAFHRFLAMVGLVGVVTHVTAIMLDSYAKLSLPALFGIGAKPSVVFGAIALWLVVTLPLSFRLRKAKWISQKVWRGFHWFGYAAWATMLVHGVFSGTDTRSPYAVLLYSAAGGLVAGAGAWRYLTPGKSVQRRPQTVSR